MIGLLHLDRYLLWLEVSLFRRRRKEWEAVNPGTFSGIDIFLDMSKPIEKIKVVTEKTTDVEDEKIGD